MLHCRLVACPFGTWQLGLSRGMISTFTRRCRARVLGTYFLLPVVTQGIKPTPCSSGAAQQSLVKISRCATRQRSSAMRHETPRSATLSTHDAQLHEWGCFCRLSNCRFDAGREVVARQLQPVIWLSDIGTCIGSSLLQGRGQFSILNITATDVSHSQT